MGRSNPLYEFLEPLSDDVVMIFDDFLGNTLDGLYGDIWTAGNNGGDSAAPVHSATNTWKGEAYFDTGTTDDSSSYLIGNEIPFMGQYRATLNASFNCSDVSEAKFEVGLTDAADVAGAVNVKATPTSTATDFAVAVFDVDDNDDIDLITDGTTDAIAAVTGYEPGLSDDEIVNVMIGLDETKSCRMWVNGNLYARTTTGPDITTSLFPWVIVMVRTNPGTKVELYLDYIRVWQERVAIG
jgi:hypothetical protein